MAPGVSTLQTPRIAPCNGVEREQRLECRQRPTAPIESEDEFVEVVGQMFPAHAFGACPRAAFQVSEDPVDHPRRQGRRRFRGSLSRGPAVIPALLERRVSLPAVCPHDAPGAPATHFHRRDDRRLAAVAPPATTTALVPAVSVRFFDEEVGAEE